MPLPKELTTVTSLSKGLALVIFILLPCISFLVGYNYGYQTDNIARNIKSDISSEKATSIKDSLRIEYQFKDPNTHKVIYLASNNSSNRLIISDKDVDDVSAQTIYSFHLPGAQGFIAPVYTVGNYGIANYNGGDAGSILLFTLGGKIITDSITKLNPELSDWIAWYDGEKINEKTIKIKLGKISTESAVAEIGLATGKMTPNTFKRTLK